MCGIAGIIGDLAEERAEAALVRMLQAQLHRGPDDGGMEIFQDGDNVVGLGSRRLAIIDTSPLGHQPMVNPDTGDVVAYNGEIYNAPELRHDLENAGFVFRGRSDTEVLLRAYERWGMQCLERLKGMFAFGLWDNRSRRLFLARDPLGIKPLYCASVPTRIFLFASEVRTLLATGLLSGAVDRHGLASYLAFGAVQEPLTVVEDIFSLAPGSWVEVDGSGQLVRRNRYWKIPQPDMDGGPGSRNGLVEEGRALLEKAVRRHLLSDVPLGVFLSSGLDSTAVLGLASRVKSNPIQAFTISFPDSPEFDEGGIAAETANRFHVAHHDCPMDWATALKWAQDGMAAMDQPAMDGLNTYMISRAVREQGMTVALSGLGGDELFGGYPSFRRVPQWLRRMNWLGRLPPSWRVALARIGTAGMQNSFQQKAHDVARTGPDLLPLYFQCRRLISDGDLASLGIACSDLEPSFHCSEETGTEHLIDGDAIASVRRLETAFYLRNMLLRDSDVFGMANSIEIRVPLLDQEVLEWAFRLPGGVFLPAEAPGKQLLREMCADIYSQAHLNQPKRGFALPFAGWLQGPLRGLMEESLSDVKRSGLVEAEGVDRLHAVFLREPRSPAWSRVWALVTLGFWLRQHHVTSKARLHTGTV